MREFGELEDDLVDWIESKVDMICPIPDTTHKNKHGSAHLTFALIGDNLKETISKFKEEMTHYITKLEIEGPKVLYWRAKPTIKIEEIYQPRSITFCQRNFIVRARFVVDKL